MQPFDDRGRLEQMALYPWDLCALQEVNLRTLIVIQVDASLWRSLTRESMKMAFNLLLTQ